MHPALSIVAFTTASGLGYGLAIFLGLGVLDPAALSTKAAHVLSLCLIGGGLLSSTLHLGNPQRAWRAFSQWRSSWLSREGVMAVFTFVPLVLSAYASLFLDRYLPITGLIGAVLATMTVYCTAMIYASLKAIDAWHTQLTPVNYLLFAFAGGAVLALAFASMAGETGWLPLAALIVAGASWFAKWRWWQRLDGLTPLSSPETATGLGHIGDVRLFERPHQNENYLTREMGFRVARKHAEKLRLIAVASGIGLTGLLLIMTLALTAGPFTVGLTVLAALSYAFGLVVERWLFFAEARHAVMNYYGQ